MVGSMSTTSLMGLGLLILAPCALAFWSTPKEPLTVRILENGEWEFPREISITFDGSECKSLEHNEFALATLLVSKLPYSILGNWWTKEAEWKVFSMYGEQAHTCEHLQQYSKTEEVEAGTIGSDKGGVTVHLVGKDKLFMWPFYPPGTRHVLKHTTGADGVSPVVLEAISKSPFGSRVYKLTNFLSEEDSDALIDHALGITDEDFMLKRSTTGNTPGLNGRRTSENAFDTGSETAMKLKKRSFEVLGIPEFDARLTDGLQILRYNVSQAYITHMDYFTGLSSKEKKHHNYESQALDGANRYATVFFYLSDVEDGGETVFPYADGKSTAHESAYAKNADLIALPKNPSEEELSDAAYTDQYIESNGLEEKFPKNSWERDMVRVCQSERSLSVKPKKALAILFYSQHPDQTADLSSLHGGCPVLKGQKWAANLWVWNRPRNGNWLQDFTKGKYVLKPENLSRAIGIDIGADISQGKLFFNMIPMEDDDSEADESNTKFFTDVTAGFSQVFNTYVGHRFSLHVGPDDKMVWSARVPIDPETHFFSVSLADLDLKDRALAAFGQDDESEAEAEVVTTDSTARQIEFVLTADVKCGSSGCNLFYGSNFFAELVPAESYGLNTFIGHKWNVYADGVLVWHGQADPGKTTKDTVFITGYMQGKARKALSAQAAEVEVDAAF